MLSISSYSRFCSLSRTGKLNDAVTPICLTCFVPFVVREHRLNYNCTGRLYYEQFAQGVLLGITQWQWIEHITFL